MVRPALLAMTVVSLVACSTHDAADGGGGGGGSTSVGGGTAVGGGGGGGGSVDAGGGSGGDGGSDAGPSTCDGLDAGACAARSDCVADTCESQCNCTKGWLFAKCRAPNEQPFFCPHIDCGPGARCDDLDASVCGTDSCAAQPGPPPDENECCSCNEPCSSDSTCDAGFICDSNGCGCGTVCQAPCSVTGCDPGLTCQADGRCRRPACTPFVGCDAFEDCDAGACIRATCTGSCDGGFCVNGLCYAELGVCRWRHF